MNAARRLFLLLPLVLGMPAAPQARAQAAAELPKKEISEKATAGFVKLQPLLDAKDYAGALALTETLLADSAPASFDTFTLLQLKAQVLIAQNRYVEAVAPLESAHALAEKNPNFVETKGFLERLHLLAQLHYQVGSEQKTPAAQRAAYEKALSHVRSWFKRSPAPSAEMRLFAASLHYNLATLEPGVVDKARLREAITQAREALVLSAKSAARARALLVTFHGQLGETALAAEQQELLVAADPQNAPGWSQLEALYLAAAAELRDPAAARAANLRVLLTLDRAQALGFLTSPKDNYTRVAVLFNLRQFARAAELLEKGLAAGTLEDTTRNWELLASACQLLDRHDRAIAALDRAVAKFPQDGALELSLAQSLYTTGRLEEAYARGRSALEKPGIEKPGQARLSLAFLAYELERPREARAWLARARAAGQISGESVESLERAIEDALGSREAPRKP